MLHVLWFFVIITPYFQVPNSALVIYCYITNHPKTWKLKARNDLLYFMILRVSNLGRAQPAHTTALYSVQWYHLVVLSQWLGWSGGSRWLHTHFWCLTRGGWMAKLIWNFWKQHLYPASLAWQSQGWTICIPGQSSQSKKVFQETRNARWSLLKPWTKYWLGYIFAIFY